MKHAFTLTLTFRTLSAYTYLIGILLLPLTLAAQLPMDTTFFSGMKARNIGPAGMSGRVSAVEAALTDPNIIYVGAATGGVWKSTSGGITWTPVFDAQNTSSIGSIAINPKNANTVWVGTGEGNVRNSAGVGRGLFKTTDAGKTWQYLGLEKTERIHRIALHPDNPDIAYVAAMGTSWSDNPDRGIFKTVDGGKTWSKILYVDARTGAAEMVMDPRDPNRILVGMWQHRRYPWEFHSGGPGSGLYLTTNGGQKWQRITSKEGLPEGELGRIGLAFSASSPGVVYALVEAAESALLRSDNGGYEWHPVNKEKDVNPRPFYFCDIRVDPQNENRVFRLQTTLDQSTDGGKTFKPLFPYSLIHPDHHALWIHPDGKLMINGNDGGVAISRDGGNTWRFVENIPLAQFYHVSVDMEYPYNVYGGLQDNGSWRGPSNSFKRDGIYNGEWEMVGFGDGFAVEPDPENPEYGYAMSQGGALFYYHYKTATRKVIRPTETDEKHRYNWNAAIALDPFDKSTLYYGSQYVHKSTDKGRNWQIISPDLTTNDPVKQNQAASGGITRDVTAAENHTTILSIAPSKVKAGVIWVGTDDGNVQVTTDGGKTWKLVSDKLTKGRFGLTAGASVPHVEASPHDAATAFVVYEDHQRYNWRTYIFVTRDYGNSWQSLTTPEIDGFAWVIRQDLVNKELLFLGTEFGLYVSLNGGRNWTKWTSGLPTVPIRDMVIHPREHDLVIGTHGRGIYIIDDIRPLRTLNSALAAKPLHMFEIPAAQQFNTTFWAGAFVGPGDAAFVGEPRKYGAAITYSLNPPDSVITKIGTGKGPNLSIRILNSDSVVVRTLWVPVRQGINRAYWDLTRAAFKPLKMEEEGKNKSDKGGISALPGTYVAKITYGTTTVTQAFTVESDPRLPVSLPDLKQRYEALLKAGEMMEVLTDAYRQIQQTKKSIRTVSELAKLHNDSLQAVNLRKLGDALAIKLDSISNKMVPDENRSGIHDRTAEILPNVQQLINTLESSAEAPSQAATVKYEKLKRVLDKVLEEYNQLYATEVAAYRQLVEQSGIRLFGQVRPVSVKQ